MTSSASPPQTLLFPLSLAIMYLHSIWERNRSSREVYIVASYCIPCFNAPHLRVVWPWIRKPRAIRYIEDLLSPCWYGLILRPAFLDFDGKYRKCHEECLYFQIYPPQCYIDIMLNLVFLKPCSSSFPFKIKPLSNMAWYNRNKVYHTYHSP